MRLTAPYSWYGWLTVTVGRVQWTPPWGCTRWALPYVKYYRGGDEHCNNTLLIQLPLLGHVVLWKPWGRLGTTPYDECAPESGAETVYRFCPSCGEWLAWPAEWPPFEQAIGNDQYGGLLNLPPHDCEPRPRDVVARRFGFDV